ncbi:MAG TPA: hypothetical protein VK897_24970 [Anaerolineales bacterium]|nr:hypothetical protein [Anaerolineales bacterium]
MGALNPFPDVIIPGISLKVNYCIFRVNRTFDGIFEGPESATHSYICGTEPGDDTSRFTAKIRWRITGASDCDESTSILPTSVLNAKGTTIVRNDGFAHFSGKFKIVTEQLEEPTITYFEGRMELIGRSGSHQKLGEECNQDNHVEGWLIGRGRGPVPEYTLRVVIVGNGQLSVGTEPFPDASANRLTGTVMKRH